MSDTQQPDGATASLASDETSTTEPIMTITMLYHSQPIHLPFAPTATIQDLSETVSTDLSIPSTNQKFLISPRPGLLKPPFANPTLPLSDIQGRKITLLGATTNEITDLNETIGSIRSKQQARTLALRAGRKVHANKSVDSQRVQDESTYTFSTIKALPYMRDPAKSQRFLERLASDPGIKSTMRQHKFRVGLLTEMDPAAHTTHESRTLGLNRNAGEVIELRLRTDAGDGYRDYKVIRNTLCHELAHNVFGPHDGDFWKLCREIEKEVNRGDWTRGGRSVGSEEFYNPEDEGEDEEADGGGWTGGEYVLGAGPSAAGGRAEPMGRREIMAKAAEERMKKQKDTAEKASEQDGDRETSSSG